MVDMIGRLFLNGATRCSIGRDFCCSAAIARVYKATSDGCGIALDVLSSKPLYCVFTLTDRLFITFLHESRFALRILLSCDTERDYYSNDEVNYIAYNLAIHNIL